MISGRLFELDKVRVAGEKRLLRKSTCGVLIRDVLIGRLSRTTGGTVG